MEEFTRENIEKNVQIWVSKYLHNFSFRQYQLEYIINTIESILNNNQLNIIEAPTGSGKSIMVLIMAGVLDKFYNKTSYILCSDLYLWQQYADVIEQQGLYFGKIKGVQHNYICDLTGEDYSVAPCKLAYIGYGKLFNDDWCMCSGWACACSCTYIQERKKALASHVTLMPYQLYLVHMNEIAASTFDNNYKSLTFQKRNIIFCDECHNIPNICQEYGDIEIDLRKLNDKINTSLTFCKEENIVLPSGIQMSDFNIDDYLFEFNDLFHLLSDISHNKQQELYDNICKLKEHLKIFEDCDTVLQEIYQKKAAKSNNKAKLTKREYKGLDCTSYILKVYGSIENYTNFTNGNVQYLVKTDNKVSDSENFAIKRFPDNPILYFKYAKEDVLVYNFLLQHAEYTVMLSATVGDQSSFEDNIGAKYTAQQKSVMFRIPSTFDFSKSPIYFIPGYKMSKAEINQSFPINGKTINAILKSIKHINEKGIIHTGSYKNAYDLLNYLDEDVKKRVYIYSTSKEKQNVLDDFINSSNGVLIGPTLTEGIDLPNDGCRFIIIMKIPYPYLGDNLVKAKISLFPKWYNSETSNNVIQGIGRGNRTPNDWSTTYILDGSFSKLYMDTHNQYPAEMRNRIHVITNKH